MDQCLKKCKKCGNSFTEEQDFLLNSSKWHFSTNGNFWFNCSCGSTMMIKDDKVPWYRFEKTLTVDAFSAYNKYPGLKKIPYIPETIMEIHQLLEDPNSSATSIANKVRQTPVLAVEILRVANMYVRDPSIKVDTLEHAVGYLGTMTLSKMLLVSFVALVTPNSRYFSKEEFWHSSYMTGAISEKIGKSKDLRFSHDMLYIAGTLVNIGKLVLATYVPEEYDKIHLALEASPLGTRWVELERKYKIPQHTALGELVGAVWGMEEDIIEVISKHHSPTDPATDVTLVDIVSLANQLTHWASGDPDKIDEPLMNSLMTKIGISEKEVEGLIGEVLTELGEITHKMAS